MKIIILLWLITANLLALILFAADKAKAKKRRWRIPERVLLGVASLGGGVGAFLGMQLFHHKTRHLKFILGIPLCILLNAAVLWFLYTKGFFG